MQEYPQEKDYRSFFNVMIVTTVKACFCLKLVTHLAIILLIVSLYLLLLDSEEWEVRTGRELDHVGKARVSGKEEASL